MLEVGVAVERQRRDWFGSAKGSILPTVVPPRRHRLGLVWILALLLLVAASPASAQTPRFTVFLTIPKQNEYTERTRSFLARDLRELKDVALVDRAGQFVVSVVPVPIQVSDGPGARTIALALSYFFEDGDLIVHDVFVGGPQDLRALCEKVIARFDVGILQPKREGKR